MKKNILALILSFSFAVFIINPLILAGQTAFSKIRLLDVKKFQTVLGLQVSSVDFSKQSLGDAIEETENQNLKDCFQTMIEANPELGDIPSSAGYFVWEGKEKYCMQCENVTLRIKFETVSVLTTLIEKLEMTDKTSFLHKIVDALVPVALAGDRYNDGMCNDTPGFDPSGACAPLSDPKPLSTLGVAIGLKFWEIQSADGGSNPFSSDPNSGTGECDNDGYCGPDPNQGNPNSGDA